MTILRATLAAATVLALAACEPRATFFRPAGATLDDGNFAAPTRANIALQSGEGAYLVDLDARFEAAVPTMVTFPFDSAALTPDAQAILQRQAHFIRSFPELRFSVFGHADLVGPELYNRQLGLARARAVVDYFARLGVDRSRLAALVSYGEERPLVPVPGRERLNRRAVTEVSGFVRTHPTVLNGKYAAVIFREYVASAVPPPPESGIYDDAIAPGG